MILLSENNDEISESYYKISELKLLFKEPEYQKYINNNDFDPIFGYLTYNYIELVPALTFILDKSNIDFLNYIRSIPDFCFFNLNFKISELILPSSIEEICFKAFAGVEGLKTLVIPDSIINYEDKSLLGLENIIFKCSKERLCEVVGLDDLENVYNYLGIDTRFTKIEFEL